MAWCPLCRSEYREGVTVCPECGKALVDELPSETEPEWDPTDWVTVEEVGDRATAAIVEGFLLEQGFPVRLLDRSDSELVTTLGELSIIEVQVPAGDLDRALDLLAERDEALEAEPGPGDEGEDRG